MSGCSVFSEDSNSPDVLEGGDEVTKFISMLFDTKKYSDVKFVVNGIEYRAHKIILLRFDYFESMFDKNWEEGKQNEIPIRDVEPEIFDIMMEFVYKGRLLNWTEKMEKYSVDLIKAANMVRSKTSPETIYGLFYVKYY